MIYLKSVLFGVAGAAIASVLWVLVTFVLPVTIPMLLSRFSRAGAAGGRATISEGSVVLAALIGFAAGFFWGIRR